METIIKEINYLKLEIKKLPCNLINCAKNSCIFKNFNS